MSDQSAVKELLKKGLACLKEGEPARAVPFFEEMLLASDLSPLAHACLGLAMARAGKDLAKAEAFCLEAVMKKPVMGEYYRTLAEVYLIQGKKAEAIEALKTGAALVEGNAELVEELKRFGIRKRPVIPFLPRSNFFNRNLGRVLSKLRPGHPSVS